ncbi:type IV secretion system protein [Paucibacter sp. O1-1]|uniref:type IV secretion system protein n=1 Tax=Paucibacter sp. M5-1 TaxID=3015998 RepID=UPI0021D4F919|nr:type IV secretion system protein [Paucibacter sp. M5-1]MCU7373228.1 type IV secretion system protein [Paucibacter sp. O1-1]MCZ7879525.1 type IV secretion system protein [Paucibacter sp. M5-1]MDA3828227.1 type IV secretion system protein [Paucibacter sp. O1-1]
MHKRHSIFIAVCIIASALSSQRARAQGIPVIDAANLIQTIQQVMNDITAINNQVQQIVQLQEQLSSISGVRNLGDVFNNPQLRNYVPAEAYTLINAVGTSGYSGLNTTAKTLRDRHMAYNCLDRSGDEQTRCQAELAQPYQQKGLLQDAMKSAAGRLTQIQSLMRQINATDDQKAVLEIQARIGAENALLAHEMSQLQMLQGMSDGEERIARSRERERQYQMLSRTGKVADYLP